MIPQDIIQNVIEQTKIEDIVGQVVKLSRKGANLTGLCPFHQEKTPSLMVSPSKGIYKCFGCGEGGDAAKFLMKQNGISFPEAIKIMATKLNIKIEEKAPDPEAEMKAKYREQLINFNEFAAKYYMQQLTGPALEYVQKRMTQQSIAEWEIGYAPQGYGLLAKAAKEAGYKEEFMLQTGLIRQSDKTHQLYDFFQKRIIFPIRDHQGRLISFTGRIMPGADAKQAKYINLSDTELYSKSQVLYGLNISRGSISQKQNAILVEGNTDVIKMHELDFINSIAPGGTALTLQQLKILKRYTNSLLMLYDGDNAGQKAAIKNSKLAIEAGFFVSVVMLEDGTDPGDAWANADDANAFINENKIDFITWYANRLAFLAGEDPGMKNEAIKEISELIINFEPNTREVYIDQVTGRGKFKTKLIRDRLKDLEKQQAPSDESEKDHTLPPGVDAADFDRWGFYEYRNEYYFRTKTGHEKLSNFVMRPVFHIDSIYESKRIYELENTKGYRVVVDLDMQEMTSLQAFQRNVEGKGNFLFLGQPGQFNRLKLKLYEQTRTCREVRFLGWQKEGFWCWSNGMITPEGDFKEIDEYGVVEFNGHHYFIPAFSQIYINDKSIFIDERKFLYKTREISLQQWAHMFTKVFGNNAIMGICFWVAATFRDVLLHIFKNFPLLNLFGPKGTGKSQMAMSLSCLYGMQQTPHNIHNGTKAGLAAHLEQFSNAFAWVDEYKNSIDYDKIENLKSIYDAIGRSRMNMDKGKKKETTNVNSAVILSGQEMPTADIALFSRVIFLRFHQSAFTDSEKKNYDTLKNTESDGLSHLTTRLLKYRQYFVKEYYDVYQDTINDFNDLLSKNEIEDRIVRSMVSIVSAWRTIARKIDFPFTYNEVKDIAIDAILVQNEQISSSNELGQFWAILEAMFDENILIDEWHFRIDFTDSIKVGDKLREFKPARHILKFKYNSVYGLYAQTARRQGLKPMPSDTLKYYLINHKNFVGLQKACVFNLVWRDQASSETKRKRQNTSAFCFDYEMLKINLMRETEDMDTGTHYNGSSTGPSPAVPNLQQTSLDLTKSVGPENDLPF